MRLAALHPEALLHVHHRVVSAHNEGAERAHPGSSGTPIGFQRGC